MLLGTSSTPFYDNEFLFCGQAASWVPNFTLLVSILALKLLLHGCREGGSLGFSRILDHRSVLHSHMP